MRCEPACARGPQVSWCRNSATSWACAASAPPTAAANSLIRPDVHVSLELAHGDGVTELPTGARNARLKATDPIAGPAIAARLIVEIAHQADLELLGQEPRRAPVQMDVDAALIFGGGIDEVVGQSSHRRKFIPRLLIEI